MLKNLVIWIVAMVFLVLSCTIALGAIAKKRSPDFALTLNPKNGFAEEAAAVVQAKAYVARNRGTFPDQIASSVNILASKAFVSEPVASGAVAVLALSNQGGDRRALMRKAFALSRRQKLATGWLIADSASQQDVSSILRYYDTTLRTNASSELIVIPIIANALSKEGFIEPLASILQKSPPWASSFWRHVVSTPEAVNNAAQLRLRLFEQNDLDSHYRDADLINALVSQARFETAEELYGVLSQQNNRKKIVRNGEFLALPRYPPLDWQLKSTGEFGASINDGALILSAIPNSGGMFARQLIRLPRETFVLNIMVDENIPENASLYIDISCAENAKQKTGSIKIPIDGKRKGQLISNTKSNCRYYWLSLFGRALETGNGFDVSVASIAISPVRR